MKPRLLVVANLAMNDSSANGRTLKNLLCGFEAEELAKICPHEYVFSLTDECFTRKLYNSGLAPDKTGEAISRYIRNLDSSLQSFLASPSESEPQLLRLGSEYLQLINDTII